MTGAVLDPEGMWTRWKSFAPDGLAATSVHHARAGVQTTQGSVLEGGDRR